MSADETIEKVRERAALYALGALTPAQAREVEERVAAGDPCYQAELAAFRPVADALAYAARPLAPPPSARRRVLERIAADGAAIIDQQGFRFVRSRDLGWEPGIGAGIEIKTLMTDPVRGRSTVLVRMAPGTAYPNHRHRDVEELYLIEGDLLVNGVRMSPGDYCSADPGTVHDGIRTVRGCSFIATASVSDELLA